jgi:hypothetical protein
MPEKDKSRERFNEMMSKLYGTSATQGNTVDTDTTGAETTTQAPTPAQPEPTFADSARNFGNTLLAPARIGAAFAKKEAQDIVEGGEEFATGTGAPTAARIAGSLATTAALSPVMSPGGAFVAGEVAGEALGTGVEMLQEYFIADRPSPTAEERAINSIKNVGTSLAIGKSLDVMGSYLVGKATKFLGRAKTREVPGTQIMEDQAFGTPGPASTSNEIANYLKEIGADLDGILSPSAAGSKRVTDIYEKLHRVPNFNKEMEKVARKGIDAFQAETQRVLGGFQAEPSVLALSLQQGKTGKSHLTKFPAPGAGGVKGGLKAGQKKAQQSFDVAERMIEKEAPGLRIPLNNTYAIREKMMSQFADRGLDQKSAQEAIGKVDSILAELEKNIFRADPLTLTKNVDIPSKTATPKQIKFLINQWNDIHSYAPSSGVSSAAVDTYVKAISDDLEQGLRQAGAHNSLKQYQRVKEEYAEFSKVKRSIEKIDKSEDVSKILNQIKLGNGAEEIDRIKDLKFVVDDLAGTPEASRDYFAYLVAKGAVPNKGGNIPGISIEKFFGDYMRNRPAYAAMFDDETVKSLDKVYKASSALRADFRRLNSTGPVATNLPLEPNKRSLTTLTGIASVVLMYAPDRAMAAMMSSKKFNQLLFNGFSIDANAPKNAKKLSSWIVQLNKLADHEPNLKEHIYEINQGIEQHYSSQRQAN